MKDRKKLIRILDSLVKEYVILRDKCCVVCGEADKKILASGHYFSRYHLATRFDLKNNNCQCHVCNARHEEDIKPYKFYMIGKYGKAFLEELEIKKNKITIVKTWELETLRDYLKIEIEELKKHLNAI
ncbi:MAG TPA: recombination protein NinG [Candidatus Paceibacterota bacterium]|nr:recombination protein NinG [Candidatus Paceibacterota bacterium]